MQEHTILVAFVVEAETREGAERDLGSILPAPGTSGLGSYWVAEDDRHDRSDCDSAVFVHPGRTREAYKLLVAHGLTSMHNAYPEPGRR